MYKEAYIFVHYLFGSHDYNLYIYIFYQHVELSRYIYVCLKTRKLVELDDHKLPNISFHCLLFIFYLNIFFSNMINLVDVALCV